MNLVSDHVFTPVRHLLRHARPGSHGFGLLRRRAARALTRVKAAGKNPAYDDLE
ncbi:hypothetical protein [Spirosoma sordidisoli]|uniref:hypothetical protein n=1 Tax=Spirosoma sordidisoli TaxID=2502893 RepID=UPI0013EAB581|nr:hypothetical protein [Spirosoma sordidisoli]